MYPQLDPVFTTYLKLKTKVKTPQMTTTAENNSHFFSMNEIWFEFFCNNHKVHFIAVLELS